MDEYMNGRLLAHGWWIVYGCVWVNNENMDSVDDLDDLDYLV